MSAHATAPAVGAVPAAPRLRFIDAVNPVTRLAAVVVLTTPLLLTVDWLSAAVALGIQLLLFAIAGVTPRLLVARTWPILIAAPVAGVSMLLYGRPEGTEYWSFWLARVTDGSIELAVAITVRVLALGLPAALLFLRVDPTELADGLAQIARLPSRFVLGALAATRLVGLFVEDWRAMALSRRARGIGEHGTLRRIATMAFALLVLAIRRGSKLATAMEARGFGSEIPRTWARQSRVGSPDAALLVMAIAIAAVSIAVAMWAGTFHPVWA